MISNFAAKSASYIESIGEAHAKDQPERHLSHLFLGFISDAFGVQYQDIELEHHITMSRVQKRGYIDALIGDLIIEFKRNIKTKTGANIDQLQNYMRDMPDSHRYIGMLTDGIDFRTYILDEANQAKEIDRFNIASANAEAAYLWLDAYLFSRREIEPTADDIVQRFGINSPTFQLAYQTFAKLLSQIENRSEIDVWREQWRALLSKVYGSDIGDDELFLRHTYLSQFAKLLAFTSLNGPAQKNNLESIVDGKAFSSHGVDNIGENDFFSWILLKDIRSQSLDLLNAISVELRIYDLSAIRQDLLKQLYQNMVDPKTRHDLGEYYTPDWLAQLTLREIDYRYPQSLLDPACGSGAFLFNAIRRLADDGLTGQELVDFALGNIMGTDVHPLAVTIARVNYLLALAGHINTGNGSGEPQPIPVFLADALIRPLENRSEKSVTIPVDPSYDQLFHIPLDTAADAGKLTKTIQRMDQFAKLVPDPSQMTDFVALFKQTLGDLYGEPTDPILSNHWTSNLRLLAELIRDGRNGIWSYILSNLSRPLVMAENGFDVVVGNPPWLAYRYIQRPAYQDEVKSLYSYYQLIEAGDVNLHTQMDLSSLFFAHARDRYLKKDGVLAFVMPRSVLTGAKQHRLFQRQGISRVLDVKEVEPLFNVPAAVLILSPGAAAAQDIPTKSYRGRFDKHELPLSEAEPQLRMQETVTRFVDSAVRSSYHDLFTQGASLVPRNLCFVRPTGVIGGITVETDPELDKAAKAPWKGIKLWGSAGQIYTFGALLSKHLLPFGYQKLNMVILPARLNAEGKLEMRNEIMDIARDLRPQDIENWFRKLFDTWERHKKSSMTFPERLDYHSYLTRQSVRDRYRVIYNSSGTHIASCVLDMEIDDLRVYRRRVEGIVIDSTCYHYTAPTESEAHYLCALLNSPFVNEAKKKYQSQGLWGPRDIHRTPFEACAIPLFDDVNPDHLELARLSQAAHAKIDVNKLMEENRLLNGGSGRARGRARELVADEISAIDEIAQRVLA